jgi:hypothetical protein
MISHFLENGILAFIHRHFPNFGSISLYCSLASHSVQARDALLAEGYLPAIHSLFDSEDSTREEIVSLCRAIVRHPIEFEPYGPEIFSLFTEIAAFSSDDKSLDFEILNAFLCLVRSNDAFIAGVVLSGLLPRFIQSTADDPDYFLRLLGMLSFICNSNDDLIEHLIEARVLEFASTHLFEEEPHVAAAAVELISDIILKHPEVLDRGTIRDTPETIVDLFGSDPFAEVKLSGVHFAVVSLALASERKFDELVHVGCLSLLLAGIDLVQPEEIAWTLRILLRGHRRENTSHAVRYLNDLRMRPPVISWLEEVRDGANAEYAAMAGEMLERILHHMSA